jgi:hypothetical protein
LLKQSGLVIWHSWIRICNLVLGHSVLPNPKSEIRSTKRIQSTKFKKRVELPVFCLFRHLNIDARFGFRASCFEFLELSCSSMNHPAKLAVSVLVVTSILVTAGIVLTGCSNSSRPRTYPVTGTVTLQGKPLAGAAVTFVPTGEGEAASAITDSDGKYALTTWRAGDGAQPGEYRVKVSKQEQTAVDPSKMVKNLSIEEEQKIYVENKKLPPPAKSLIPSKYQDDQTSGLVHTVEKKPTTFDIKIE